MTGAAREVLTFDAADFAERTATLIEETIRASASEQNRCRIVLAGGRTPASVYRVLAQRTGIPWAHVDIFVGDERCVPLDHPDSNYRMITETLLDALPTPKPTPYPLQVALGSEAAAVEYTMRIAALPEPKFDFVLSGVGADGHTASLFPGDDRVMTTHTWAMVATAPPQFPVKERVGLTLRALNSTRLQCVLCTGADKRAVRARILGNAPDAAALPAALLSGQDRTIWIVDPL